VHQRQKTVFEWSRFDYVFLAYESRRDRSRFRRSACLRIAVPKFTDTPSDYDARSTSDPVRIPKAAQIVTSRIRRRIVDRELKLGERLAPEAELAAAFAVSRPVVREALRVLESEHLIKLGRGARHGAKVCDPTSEIVTRAVGITLRMNRATLADIFDARAVCEPAAARLAALRRPAEASTALRRQVAHQVSLIDDEVAFQRLHGAFHRVLLEECGNTTLAVVGLALQETAQTHLELIREGEWVPDRAVTRKMKQWTMHSYLHLADLIEQQDGPAAETHWRQHLNAVGRYWIRRDAQLSILRTLD
jgi:DNA-binding FadR family transcriptional regulator